jgi:glucose-1-phosphatase
MSRDIELVIFDLGRVLIKICDGWQHACEVAGIPRPGDIDATCQQKLMEFVQQHEVGNIDFARFTSGCAPLLGISAHHVAALSNAYLLGPYEGAMELVDRLNAAGLKTACLSNTNANHWRLVTDRDNPNYLTLENLTHVFASHLVRMRKPEDRIYAHVEQVTRVAPERIIFFDDMEENIAASRRRGWHGYQIAMDRDPITQARTHLKARGINV